MRKQTPWGAAQDAIELAEGIKSYSTDSHGGIWLSKARQEVIAKAYPHYPNWLGGLEWWEEDCDWAIPYVLFADDIKKFGKVLWFERNLAAAKRVISSLEGFWEYRGENEAKETVICKGGKETWKLNCLKRA